MTRARRKEERERRSSAMRELLDLQDSLAGAYSAFNHTADPALLEASILEIGALQSRYNSALRRLKVLMSTAL